MGGGERVVPVPKRAPLSFARRRAHRVLRFMRSRTVTWRWHFETKSRSDFRRFDRGHHLRRRARRRGARTDEVFEHPPVLAGRISLV